jgi:hypothetical protein
MGFRSHGAAAISAQYAYIFANLTIQDALRQTLFVPVDAATLGKPGGQRFANSAVVDYSSWLTGPMRGDTLQVRQLQHIKGMYTSGVMQGSEEKMNWSYITFTAGRKRHALAYEQYAQDKAWWQLEPEIRTELSRFVAHMEDKLIFDAAISGTTANYHATAGTQASAGVAAMATAGMTVATLDAIAKNMEARNAKPLFFSQGPEGAQLPGYAVAMPPDQYAYLLGLATMKSTMYVSVPRSENHPLRTGALMRYKNLYLFKLGGDFTDGGSPLAPMAKLYTAVATASGATYLHLSVSTSYACPTKYLRSSGYVTVFRANGTVTKKERIHYTVKDRYKLTISRTAGDRTSHVAASSVVAQDVCHVLAFGAEVVGKIQTVSPRYISQEQDYGERKGVGIRWVSGAKRIDNTADRYPGIYLVNCCNDRTIKYLG